MRIMIPVLVIAAMLSGCEQGSQSQRVTEASVRLPAVAGRPGAAYFTIKGGSVTDRLMSVSSPLVVRTELHDMTMKDGVAKMAKIEGGAEVQARGELEFEPGGKHAMLFDISPKVTEGSTLPLSFKFASGATLSYEAKVEAAGGSDPHAGH